MSTYGRTIGLLAIVLLTANVSRAESKKTEQEIAVEIRFAEIRSEVFAGLQRKGILSEAKKDAKNVQFLNDKQVQRFMEAIQEDIHSNVMQLPRLVLADKQTGALKTQDYQLFTTGVEIVARGDGVVFKPKVEQVPLGIQSSITPNVSADRRHVKLKLNLEASSLASDDVPRVPIAVTLNDRTFTQFIQKPQITKRSMDRTLAIPDGNTAVISEWVVQQEVVERKKRELLSDIPYLGELFYREEHRIEPHHVLVLATPRILIEPEKEEKRAPKSVKAPAELIPDDAQILRAMPTSKRGRDNLTITKECLINKLDPPRFFPLIGQAQLHRCHWKCTVFYHETSEKGSSPHVEVVYIDCDHLHLTREGK